MRAQPEYQLQVLIADYLRRAYRDVPFLSDVRAATRLTIPQQVRSKKVQADGFACPDLIIFKPMKGKSGKFMELKAETPFRKDGFLKLDPHLSRQMDAINRLRELNYEADFYWDFDAARAAIDWYLR